MALYDMYEQYRQPLGEEDRPGMEQATYAASRLAADPAQAKVPGGYQHPEKGFTVDPVVKEHMQIAIARAEAQFKGFPAMPEDADIATRFPGIDPVGKYSIIDMKFKQREAAVRARLELQSPPVRNYANMLLELRNALDGVGADFHGIQWSMDNMSRRHRAVTRASKLCLDPDGRRLLHQEARNLESCKAVAEYDLLMQGIEYAAGVRTGPVPQEVADFYAKELHSPLEMDKVEMARTVDLQHPPEQVRMDFHDLDNKMLQQAFANPHNWGKSMTEVGQLAAELVDVDAVTNAIPPYARATAARTLDPIFAKTEQATGRQVNRGDLIIIDGMTVREKMFADFTRAGGASAEFDKFYARNLNQAANEYVAAGLMAGKRVEVFTPDEQGRIPAQPTQITKTGYEPSPLKPERFNPWQRYFSKHGFYKEKVARQAEYERMMAARERVQTLNNGYRWEAMNGTLPHVKGPFINGWLQEHGQKELGITSQFSVTRSAIHSFSVARMLMQGHSVEDIFDPAKLQAEKAQVGREVIEHLQAPEDLEWAGQTVFHGMRLLRDEMDRRLTGVDLSDEKQIFAQTMTAAIAKVSFDLGQERDHCKEQTMAAAGAYLRDNHMEEDAGKYFDELHTGSNAVSALFNYAGRVMLDRPLVEGKMAEYSGGGPVQILSELGAFEELKKGLSTTQPEKTACRRITGMDKLLPLMTVDAGMMGSETFQALTGRLDADRTGQFSEKLGREITSGRFQQRMRIENHMERGEFSFDIAPPEKPGDMEVRTPQQLKAAKGMQKQQRAPQRGGMGR